MSSHDSISRREILRRAALLTAVPAWACDPAPATRGHTRKEPGPPKPRSSAMTKRMPTVYLPHGGGPWPFMKDMVEQYAGLSRYLRELSVASPEPPKALLVISAHWEEDVPTVMTSATPPMLYDYYGFPQHTYQVKWPAPGAPDVATEVRVLVEKAGFRTREDSARGFDHGTFVPLMLTYPKADVPTLQLSLKTGLDPAEHLRLGRALAPLRDRGVLIVGSGMSYHNLRAFMAHLRGGPAPVSESKAFDDWLAESMTRDVSERDRALTEWERAPHARACHPREEHLLPLHVVAGAAADTRGTLPYRQSVMGAHVSAVHFG